MSIDHAEPKKKHTLRNVLVGVVALLVVIGIASCGSAKGDDNSSTAASSSTDKKKDAPKQEEAKKSWTKVIALEGKTDKNSDTIKLTGGKVRLIHEFKGDMIIGAVYVLDEGTDLMKDGGIADVMISEAGKDETILRKGKGSYYVSVKAANADYKVVLEEYK